MAASTPKVEKVTKQETLKLLEKCKKERDDAIHRETMMRDKLRHYESRIRSTEALRHKLKNMSQDNKDLRKTVKTLRADLGLESSPKFQGKTTRDIINDLHEKERQCSAMVERAGKLSRTIDELTSELANTVTSKTLLEEELASLQQNLKDMTNNQRRLLKLWEDKKAQREQLSLPAIGQRRPVVQKSIQTEMSISPTQKLPTNAFEIKPIRRETERNKSTLEKRSILQNGSHREKTALMHSEPKSVPNSLMQQTGLETHSNS
ncbi:protein Daple [Conger conger]|uniref:protein Daple n=1 Tax=Conger conger TaxID=82655 RepID=UPI002A5A712E|nr:protein Daple [Conger conger]